MNVTIDLENVSAVDGIPDEATFLKWVRTAQDAAQADRKSELAPRGISVGIRIVDEVESRELNHLFRHKDKPTNVLSFRTDLPAFAAQELEEFPLGDLAICAPVVVAEAIEQQKSVESHWAHMIIHGMLHLNGFDHEVEADAEVMEAIETRIMQSLGFADPYLITET